jgi:UDP-N-acetylmuramate: L-alanyl-gamma-D-glutamyl-meso-diaminopimelate ligase
MSDSTNYFSIDNASSLPQAGHIHIIGVCGVAMAPLALLLAKEGYHVSGSDKEFYEPMSSLLRSSEVELFEGFNTDNIKNKVDFVIIGNSCRRENVEVIEVESRKLPYSFLPRVISELIIGHTHSVVVTGTHGKSTTTALLAKIFLESEKIPGIFLGGVSKDFPESLCKGAGVLSVVEGDEYDSAFFAKMPKFHFYAPSSLIITSLEYDHADIYPNLTSIVREFEKLLSSLASPSSVWACGDYETVRSLKRVVPSGVEFFTYGVESHNDIVVMRTQKETTQTITLSGPYGEALGRPTCTSSLTGAYNALNVTAAYVVGRHLNISLESIERSISSYQGLLRRQEVLVSTATTVLIEDFAHHPTAVSETLRGIRERYPRHRICVLFEPRSNTSRRKIFEDAYCTALSFADVVLLSRVTPRLGDTSEDVLRTSTIVELLNKKRLRAKECHSPEDFLGALDSLPVTATVYVVMSNGSFFNLPQILRERFS